MNEEPAQIVTRLERLVFEPLAHFAPAIPRAFVWRFTRIVQRNVIERLPIELPGFDFGNGRDPDLFGRWRPRMGGEKTLLDPTAFEPCLALTDLAVANQQTVFRDQYLFAQLFEIAPTTTVIAAVAIPRAVPDRHAAHIEQTQDHLFLVALPVFVVAEAQMRNPL